MIIDPRQALTPEGVEKILNSVYSRFFSVNTLILLIKVVFVVLATIGLLIIGSLILSVGLNLLVFGGVNDVHWG